MEEAQMDALCKTEPSIKIPSPQFRFVSLISEIKILDTPSYSGAKSKNKKWFLVNIFKEIELNYQNPEYKVSELAFSLAMSERKLYRKCYEYMQMKPAELLREFRLNEAIQLMRKGNPLVTLR